MQEKRTQIVLEISKLHLSQGSFETWMKHVIESSESNLDKFTIPSQEEIDEWSKFPHGQLYSLRRIKHPLLCGWSVEEVIEGCQPYINKHRQSFHTNRCDMDECNQNGAIGVLMAIRTDAGIQPFAGHAYSHIKTNIRRPSVEAGIIPQVERTPSETEIRCAVGKFLSNDWLTPELDGLAHNEGFSNYASIPGNMLRDYISIVYPKIGRNIKAEVSASVKDGKVNNLEREAHADHIAETYLAKLIKNDESLDTIRVEIEKQIETKQQEIYRIANENAKEAKNRVLLKLKKYDSVMNQTNCTSKDDFSLCWVQKTGNTRARMLLINDSFRINMMPIEVIYNMLDYLDSMFPRFNQIIGEEVGKNKCRRHILPMYDSVRYATIGDIVKHIAKAPDFHNNPSTIDIQIDDDNDKRQQIEDIHAQNSLEHTEAKDKKNTLESIIKRIRDDIKFTPAQDATLCWIYGLPMLRSKEECERLAAIEVKDELMVENHKNDSHVWNDGDKWYFKPNPVNGSWLAQNFSHLVAGSKHKTITRQRVTQYIRNIHDRVISKMFEYLYQERADFVEFTEYTMNICHNLTKDEREVANLYFGLFKFRNKKQKISNIARSYKIITEKICSMCADDRIEWVKDKLNSYMRKMVGVQL